VSESVCGSGQLLVSESVCGSGQLLVSESVCGTLGGQLLPALLVAADEAGQAPTQGRQVHGGQGEVCLSVLTVSMTTTAVPLD
jgi:hypothetical protein